MLRWRCELTDMPKPQERGRFHTKSAARRGAILSLRIFCTLDAFGVSLSVAPSREICTDSTKLDHRYRLGMRIQYHLFEYHLFKSVDVSGGLLVS